MKTVNSKTFIYTSEDKSLIYEVIFTQGYPLKYTHLGKTWAKRTECTVKCNGFILATNYVTKHDKDKDSLLHAYRNAYNLVKKKIYKEARVNLIKQILEYAKIN